MDLGIIEKLAKCIVRPPKSNYKPNDLGKFEIIQYLHALSSNIEYTSITPSTLWTAEVSN